MQDENAKNCWEYWDCDAAYRLECPAFTGEFGQKCWTVARSFNAKGDISCPKVKEQFKSCLECPWFKKMNENPQ